jgi:hypothetical protein
MRQRLADPVPCVARTSLPGAATTLALVLPLLLQRP